MAAGNWMPELIDMAGGVNLFGQNGKHSPWLTWDELREADPDVLIVAPCGFDLNRTQEELHWMTDRPGWERSARRARGTRVPRRRQSLLQPSRSARGGDARCAGGNAASRILRARASWYRMARVIMS